jgi:hypothetical protein
MHDVLLDLLFCYNWGKADQHLTMGPPRKKKRVQEPAQTEGRSPCQTQSTYIRPTTVQQNSHLLETPHNTESQTGPSQQID